MAARIVVTGATGFLGRHLVPVLASRYGSCNVVGLGSRDFDLMDQVKVRAMFAQCRPDILVHLAGYSGGIGANREYPADFYHRNTLLTTLVFHEAARAGVNKLIYPMGGCSYPAHASSPIREEMMWEGYPQPESAGYSMAKKMGIVASRAYRQQYGFNSVVLIPGNMYGEYDNFRDQEAHVIPAMIRRFLEAKWAGDRHITVWGSGKPVRDFVYAGDVAAILPYFIDHYDSSDPVNISAGTATTIRYLAETTKNLTGFEGDILWDQSKPDGQLVKTFDVARLRNLGLACPTLLKDGLRRTIDWVCKNYRERGDGIRL